MFKDALLLTVFPAAMAFAAASDLLTMTVPNRIALALIASFFLLAPMTGLGWSEIGLHLLFASAALTLAFGCFTRGWIGGGDAKLFAATTLWIGPKILLSYSLSTAILGGALTLGLLFWRSLPLPATLIGQTWLVRLHDVKEIPYGIALAAAGLLVYPDTPFMAAVGN